MVSTRGIKFKFAVGEKVLCYEPDPTKAKVLYDSKILDLSVSRDPRGRKVPEYLIHFHGWSSSWDRCVKETLILRDTEENRNLQIKLAHAAAALLKGKKKQPPVIRNSLAKRENKNEERDSSSNSGASSGSESPEEESHETVEIPIPALLCKILQQDHTLITQKRKLVKLPSEAPIVSVLEEFVKSECVRLTYSSQPKRPRSGKDAYEETMEYKFQLHQEFVDGIRILFDFTLSRILLYNQEQAQYNTIARTSVPIGRMRSECPKISKKEPMDTQSPTIVVKQGSSPTVVKQGSSPTVVKQGSSPTVVKQDLSPTVVVKQDSSPTVIVKEESSTSAVKRDLSPTVVKQESSKSPLSPKEQSIDGGEITLPLSPRSRATSYAQQRGIKRAKLGQRQGLRSADKPKSMDEPFSNVPPSGLEALEQNSESNSSPLNNPVRKTRQAVSRSPVLHHPAHSPAGSSSTHSPNSIANLSAIALSNQPVVTIHPLPAISVSNLSSSASSTHSSSSCLKDRKQQQILQTNNSKLLKEVLEWKLLPDYLYEKIPAGASLIYGPHHLLRLFVQFPEILSKMGMARWKLQLILQLSNTLLNFLKQRKDEYFPASSYVDAQEQFNARN